MVKLRDFMFGFVIGIVFYFIIGILFGPRISGFTPPSFDTSLTLEQARKQADDMIKQLIEDVNKKAREFKTPDEQVKAMSEMHDNINEINKAFMKWTVSKPANPSPAPSPAPATPAPTA